MLDRRRTHRNRVCREGAVTCGLGSPILRVRLRNVSDDGAELVVPGGHLGATVIDLDCLRGEGAKRAEVVWRRMDRFGVAFAAIPRKATAGASADIGAEASASALVRRSRARLIGG